MVLLHSGTVHVAIVGDPLLHVVRSVVHRHISPSTFRTCTHLQQLAIMLACLHQPILGRSLCGMYPDKVTVVGSDHEIDVSCAELVHRILMSVSVHHHRLLQLYHIGIGIESVYLILQCELSKTLPAISCQHLRLLIVAHLVTYLQWLADGGVYLDAALGIRHIRDCTGRAVLPCLGDIGEYPLAERTWRRLGRTNAQDHRITRLQNSTRLDYAEVVQFLQLLLCVLSWLPGVVQLLGRTYGLVLVHACLVHDRVAHLLRRRLRQRTGILIRSSVIAHVAYAQVPACSCNAVVVSVVGRRQQLPLRNLVTGLDLHVVGQPALRVGREVVVQIHRAFRAVVVQHVDSVLANSLHHAGLLRPLCTKKSAESRRHVLAGLLVECTNKRSLALLERDSLCSVLAVMCDDAVRNCVHVVIAVDVDHHSRRRHFLYTDNGLQDDIVLASLYGKQVQCSVDSVIRKYCVSEVGIGIDLREHERNTVAHSGIGKPEQPVVTCDVLCDCIQSLEEGI